MIARVSHEEGSIEKISKGDALNHPEGALTTFESSGTPEAAAQQATATIRSFTSAHDQHGERVSGAV